MSVAYRLKVVSEGVVQRFPRSIVIERLIGHGGGFDDKRSFSNEHLAVIV